MSEVDREKISDKDKKILRSIDRILLKRKLKKENIEISDTDLYKVLDFYNHIIDFYLDGNRNEEHYRFGFIIAPKNFQDRYDHDFNNIFNILITLKKHNILHYVDYVLLLNNHDWLSSDKLSYLLSSLKKIMRYYNTCEEPKEEFFYNYIDNDNEYLLENVLDNHLDVIIGSKYINQEYKDIMNLYNELFMTYINLDYFEIDYEAFFQEFLNMTYYYFLINNMFNNEPQEIINYLKKIKEDIPGICDKLNIDGEMNTKNRINYIDSLYKSKNKVKVIK